MAIFLLLTLFTGYWCADALKDVESKNELEKETDYGKTRIQYLSGESDQAVEEILPKEKIEEENLNEEENPVLEDVALVEDSVGEVRDGKRRLQYISVGSDEDIVKELVIDDKVKEIPKNEAENSVLERSLIENSVEEEKIVNSPVTQSEQDIAENLKEKRNLLLDNSSEEENCSIPEHETPSNNKEILVQSKTYTSLSLYLIKYWSDDYLGEEKYKIIFDHFNGNLQEIVVFLAHCVHNTSGFSLFAPFSTNREKYGSKGVLQITSIESYRALGEPYLSNPELLAQFTKESLISELEFYSRLVPQHKRADFYETLFILKPEEVQGENYIQQYYRDRLLARTAIYEMLCEVLEVEGNLRRVRSFCVGL